MDGGCLGSYGGGLMLMLNVGTKHTPKVLK